MILFFHPASPGVFFVLDSRHERRGAAEEIRGLSAIIEASSGYLEIGLGGIIKAVRRVCQIVGRGILTARNADENNVYKCVEKVKKYQKSEKSVDKYPGGV